MLSFNVGHRDSKRSQKALVELLQRTQPDIVALQECRWTVGWRGYVLHKILGQAFPGGTWHMEEGERDGRYNTVLYNADRFDAQHCTFEDRRIDPQDPPDELPSRYGLRSTAQRKGRPWLQERYLLLRLSSRSDPALWFYLLNWHGPLRGAKFEHRAIYARQLLRRAALLVQKVGPTVGECAGCCEQPV